MIDPTDPEKKIVRELEIRRDPLLEHGVTIAPHLTDKVLFGETDQDLLHELVESSKQNCFMCPENVEQSTPCYPDSPMLPGGRIKFEEAFLFPNLFPLSKYHAVVRMTKDHYVSLRNQTTEIWSNSILASLQFIKWVNSIDPKSQLFTINSNFLPPAGASAVHPHLQILGGHKEDCALVDRLWKRSTQYYETNNQCYWLDLVSEEKQRKDRYLWDNNVDWLVPFAPLGINEVIGIFPMVRSFLELTETDVQSVAEGIKRVLHFYDQEGFSTYNLTIYSGPLSPPVKWFRCFVRIVSRQNVVKNYRNDIFFLQKLLGTEVLPISPEAVALKLREHNKHQKHDSI